ncbi:MAG: hypothetical protein A2745_01625 [Candidatus Harrisonbacteria bacterium RIFCSPHIGHO2_01_FULL_44_13]|uniref:General secretion pathway GspH domain-containing protein n=1 Tax=Candidatus Harrisonbacteria bacterium RIFCSPLOWO2_01_FULL_44_18 TaxID=1798407 RepID=A0A1G1ZM38_9BACT|nr:MAG: hypothetical protein A2745_01625 [Candidatus Harrisonbacteria bacterium RIFCSPHIGHO2_01_FULL_44_13]OGY65176.1 MAG: hypothetical protein A3A16_00585 [Candidatus Harrisonbacteria bacterium RIFCSPLOWO2_01_FULL_44_18]
MSQKTSAGFTILEMLVIVSVMALLSAMLLVYNRSGEKQISLFKEQAKVISVILRSKALAIQTFQQATPGCGYGVHFEAGKYWIFRDLPDPTTGCSGSDRKYSGSAENFEVFTLESGLYFSELTLSDILFVPPDPRVFLNPDQAEATITLSTSDNASQVNIKINDAGQVTTQ